MGEFVASIATSIMPKRIEAQQVAIASWLKLGFNVYSINSPAEISHIKLQFPNVHFVEIHQPQTQSVSINSLLDTLSTVDASVCGIVNSDIELQGGLDFLHFLEEETKTSLICGSRIDVDSSTGLHIGEHRPGLDYFFFPAKFIEDFPKAAFYLGQPNWDYWFPLVSIFHGRLVKRLVTPIAFHAMHQSTWGEREVEAFAAELFASLQDIVGTKTYHDSHVQYLADEVRHRNFGCLQFLANRYLRAYVPWVHCQPATLDGMVLVPRRHLNELREIIACDDERERQMMSSRSWRLTAPLRALSPNGVMGTFLRKLF